MALRRISIGIGGSLLLLAVLFGFLSWQAKRAYIRALSEYERHVGPADHNLYLVDPVADERNAAIAFPSAMAGVVLGPDWRQAPRFDDWQAHDLVRSRTLLASEGPALARLHAAAQLAGCSWPSVPDEELAWSEPMLRSSRLLRLAGFVAVADGDGGGVERAVDSLGRLSDCLHRQPHIVGSLVATAVDRARLEVIRAAVSSSDTAAATEAMLVRELERSLAEDRVGWALAAEGAFALRFVDQPGFAGGSSRIYPLFSRRVAARLAARWVDLRAWSRQPLEDLMDGDGPPRAEGGPTEVIADLLIPNLLEAVVKMRTVERLNRLALAVLEARMRARDRGSYEGVFTMHSYLQTEIDRAGTVSVRDTALEALLRRRYLAQDGKLARGIETTLALTSWRLPPLARASGTID